MIKPSERIKEIHEALQTLRGYKNSEMSMVETQAIMQYLDEKFPQE